MDGLDKRMFWKKSQQDLLSESELKFVRRITRLQMRVLSFGHFLALDLVGRGRGS